MLKYSLKLSEKTVSIILMLISGLSFVVMHSSAKHLAAEVHIFEIVFLRCALVAFVLLPFMFQQGIGCIYTKQPRNQFYRILTNSIAMLLFFFGLSITPISIVTSLNFIAPVFATVLAIIFLKEKLTPLRSFGLIIGFLGVLIILKPSFSINIGGLFILLSALSWSISLIFIKKLTKTDSAVTISLYAGVGMMPATFLAAYPHLQILNTNQFLIILFISISGTLAQTLLNSALKRGELSFLLPLDFLKLVWSVLIGLAIFDETTSASLWLGGLFIIVASTLVVKSDSGKNKILPIN